MTLNEFNVCKVVPARITSAAWYPSKEDLVVAAGDKFGNLGLWKIQVDFFFSIGDLCVRTMSCKFKK